MSVNTNPSLVLNVFSHRSNNITISLFHPVYGRRDLWLPQYTKTPCLLQSGDWVSLSFPRKGYPLIDIESSSLVQWLQDPKRLLAIRCLCDILYSCLMQGVSHLNLYKVVKDFFEHHLQKDCWGTYYVFLEMILIKELGFGDYQPTIQLFQDNLKGALFFLQGILKKYIYEYHPLPWTREFLAESLV